MKDEDYIAECACRKDGIKLVEPNENLCSAYLKMAKESLASMNANIDADVRRWAIVAAYYARYHAIYAIFMKAGIKCEIHTCTIAAAKAFFLGGELTKEIETTMKQRINMQYYADRTVSDSDYKKNIDSAPDFVIKMEKLSSEMGGDDIEHVREKLKEMMKRSKI